MGIRIASVTIECADVRRLADFWAAALGYEPRGEILPEGGVRGGVIQDPADRDVELMFLRVPPGTPRPPRSVLVVGADDRDAEVHRLVALGAVPAEAGASSLPGTVLRDPEGNLFSVFQTAEDNPLSSWRA